MDIQENKKTFINLYKENISRQGSEEMLSWIEKSDFYTAPASTKYHLSEEGGLCAHSIHVATCLEKLVNDWDFAGQISKESIMICGLLHDVCKINFYKTEMRNRKNEDTGAWEKYAAYTIDDQLPYGHGEKSVYIISSFMKLSREESMAIRWHMGFADDSYKGGSHSVGAAFEMYPLAFLTHSADMFATNILESKRK